MFAAFMKRWTLVIAIMWNVALTGLNHLAYDSWTKQEKEDEQRKNQKDR